MQHISLQELNQLIKATLDTHLEPSYWVVAEIGELRINQRGHCYMELVQKDDSEILAKIRANIWASTFRNLSQWFESTTGQPLKPGLKILANVVIQFHEIYGLSLNVRDIDPNFTLGERARKRQEIINQLIDLELIDQNKSIPLPLVPQRIAVISSTSAAGYGDFQNQLIQNSHNYSFELTLFNSLMQGEEAAQTILQALERIENLSGKFDLAVIIRGGGSQVDLDCFDSFDLAQAIAQMSLPILTGIGHERDQTIADMVAHSSLNTPTAVSEFILGRITEFEARLEELLDRLQNNFNYKLRREELQLNDYYHLVRQLAQNALHNKNYQLDSMKHVLKMAVKLNMDGKFNLIEKMETQLSLLNPEKILGRGYTLTSLNNKLLSKVSKINPGDKLQTYTNKFIIESTVDKTDSRK